MNEHYVRYVRGRINIAVLLVRLEELAVRDVKLSNRSTLQSWLAQLCVLFLSTNAREGIDSSVFLNRRAVWIPSAVLNSAPWWKFVNATVLTKNWVEEAELWHWTLVHSKLVQLGSQSSHLLLVLPTISISGCGRPWNQFPGRMYTGLLLTLLIQRVFVQVHARSTARKASLGHGRLSDEVVWKRFLCSLGWIGHLWVIRWILRERIKLDGIRLVFSELKTARVRTWIYPFALTFITLRGYKLDHGGIWSLLRGVEIRHAITGARSAWLTILANIICDDLNWPFLFLLSDLVLRLCQLLHKLSPSLTTALDKYLLRLCGLLRWQLYWFLDLRHRLITMHLAFCTILRNRLAFAMR